MLAASLRRTAGPNPRRPRPAASYDPGVYRPQAFAEDDTGVLLAIIDRASLAHLVAHGPDGFESSPLPVIADLHDGEVRIRGHVARPNPLWRLAPCDVLAVVPLTDAYISPSWYATKQEDGKVVPTWNYEVVHAHGHLVAHDDVGWLDAFVRELTSRHEHRREQPWAVDDAPADYVASMLRGIVGVEIAVTRLEGKRKLSQNRPIEDQQGAIAGLERTGERRAVETAGAMRTTSDP
jgi:transcriptional regulator